MRPPRRRRMCGAAARAQSHADLQIDFERRVPVGDGQLVEGLRPIDRRHVHEHIQPAEGVNGPVNDALARVGIAKVALEHECTAAEPANGGGGLLGLGARLPIDERDVGSGAGQLRRDDGSDAFAARDECDPSVQLHRAQ